MPGAGTGSSTRDLGPPGFQWLPPVHGLPAPRCTGPLIIWMHIEKLVHTHVHYQYVTVCTIHDIFLHVTVHNISDPSLFNHMSVYVEI